MIDLKPCPFCGAEMNLINGELKAWHSLNCFFLMLKDSEVDMTQEEINARFVEAWNRRAV